MSTRRWKYCLYRQPIGSSGKTYDPVLVRVVAAVSPGRVRVKRMNRHLPALEVRTRSLRPVSDALAEVFYCQEEDDGAQTLPMPLGLCGHPGDPWYWLA